MDNLTHTLIGVVAGEVAARTAHGDARGLPESTRRNALIAMGIIGGALPDIDLAWSLQAVTGDKLGYLLHHRGHTHTVLGCVLLAILLYAGVRLWFHWRRQPLGRSDRITFGAMALVAVLVHLGMDALNVYGVHPFWPWDNRWFYADSVFIIEPLYWLAATPLLFALRGRVTRTLLVLVVLASAGLLLYAHRAWLPWWAAPLPAVLLLLATARLGARQAVFTALALMVVVTLSFVLAGRVAQQRVDVFAAAQFPGFRTLDRVLSPAPAQPFCWDLQLVQVSDTRYVVREGRVSLLGALDARDCPVTQRAAPRTASLTPVAATNSSLLHWDGEFSMARSGLLAAARHDCTARAMMQFVRVPFVADVPGGWVLGDLRFDREPGAGFAEEQFSDVVHTACRYNLPWVPPRADLLRAP